MREEAFSKRQVRILAACFIAYFCAYIGRLNMSATLDQIMGEMNVDGATGGALQTVFATVYACGQFVFGAIVDHVNPVLMIAVGLCGSAASNLCFSFSGSFSPLLYIWAINGLFQSMLWTPIVRILAENYTGKKSRRASFTMSFTLALGHLAAWALAGFMSDSFGWRKAYVIPACVLLAACASFLLLMPRGKTDGAEAPSRGAKNAETGKMSFRGLLGTGLISLLFLSVANGFVRDGVITWAPTILGANKGLFTLIIPVVNLIGIYMGSRIAKKYSSGIRAVVMGLMAACVLPSVLMLLFPASPVYAMALLLGVMSASLYGSNPMLTSIVPMQYRGAGRVGLVAGLVDSFIYLGSALAGVLTGWMHDASGSWTGVYALWAVVSAAGMAAALISTRGEKKLTGEAESSPGA